MHRARPRRHFRLVAPACGAVLALAVAACGAAGPTSAPPTGPAASPTPSTAAARPALASVVSVAEADHLRAAGAMVLDVREPSEWAEAHIDGATLIPLGKLSARLAELPRDRSIVVVCRSGNRSAQGRDILVAAGFASVTSMDGGMTAWVAAGLPVVTGA